jgi:hypothetical protein
MRNLHISDVYGGLDVFGTFCATMALLKEKISLNDGMDIEFSNVYITFFFDGNGLKYSKGRYIVIKYYKSQNEITIGCYIENKIVDNADKFINTVFKDIINAIRIKNSIPKMLANSLCDALERSPIMLDHIQQR